MTLATTSTDSASATDDKNKIQEKVNAVKYKKVIINGVKCLEREEAV